MSKLLKMAMTEAYVDVEEDIRTIAKKFSWKYGGEVDELISEAHQIFMKTFKSHNPQSSEFDHWIRLTVWKGLLSNARRIARQNTHRYHGEMDFDTISTSESTFKLDEFKEGLSADAVEVVDLALMPPNDIILSAKQRPGRGNVVSYQAAIREFLIDMGWELDRIRSTFTEIRNALSE